MDFSDYTLEAMHACGEGKKESCLLVLFFQKKMKTLNVINVIGVKYDVVDICQVALYTWTL